MFVDLRHDTYPWTDTISANYIHSRTSIRYKTMGEISTPLSPVSELHGTGSLCTKVTLDKNSQVDYGPRVLDSVMNRRSDP